jgi:hypothetical protein
LAVNRVFTTLEGSDRKAYGPAGLAADGVVRRVNQAADRGPGDEGKWEQSQARSARLRQMEKGGMSVDLEFAINGGHSQQTRGRPAKVDAVQTGGSSSGLLGARRRVLVTLLVVLWLPHQPAAAELKTASQTCGQEPAKEKS